MSSIQLKCQNRSTTIFGWLYDHLLKTFFGNHQKQYFPQYNSIHDTFFYFGMNFGENEPLGLNFINVLRTAFTPVAPQSVRTQSSCLYLFTLLGTMSVKVVRFRTLMKLAPDLEILWLISSLAAAIFSAPHTATSMSWNQFCEKNLKIVSEWRIRLFVIFWISLPILRKFDMLTWNLDKLNVYVYSGSLKAPERLCGILWKYLNNT